MNDRAAKEKIRKYARMNQEQGRKLHILEKRLVTLQRQLDAKRFRKACRRPGSIVQLGRCLVARGYSVGEHPAFGGVHPVHHGVCHYRGLALDVNRGAGESPAEKAALWHVHSTYLQRIPQVRMVLGPWNAADHQDHLHVSWNCVG